ncbi:MAG: glycosyl transferase family 2 [Planctomycetaceae bacterium]|nr:glycosyl transferase family 2 [Planctomycetaceae bacterium]|tara:strand:+ start:1810 stop:2544 length:735 start_codon:yes stop_codon:yes gene_type:complete
MTFNGREAEPHAGTLRPADVTVVIPVVNEAGNLKDCICSAKQSGAEKIIVADGGSTDGSPLLAAQLGATVIKSKLGRGLQQHAGANAAQTPLLCFLHADCRLSAGALATLCEQGNRQADVYACFRQAIQARGLKYRLLEWGNGCRVQWMRRPYGDQGICISSALYHRIGGFAPVPLMEDVLLARRMKQECIRPVLLPASIEVSARRWKENGVLRQTLRNWRLLRRLRRGVSPEGMVASYRRHDQ